MGVPCKGYFPAFCVTISITFAILQIFIISKATSIDRSFNLNRVLLRDIGIFPTIIMSCQQVRQVKKCNYSECFHKNKIVGRLSINCQLILAVGCSRYISSEQEMSMKYSKFG